MTTKTVTTDAEAYRRAVDLEPRLLAVEAMVRALVALAPTDEPFCSGCLWSGVLKPLARPLVGWDRARPRLDAQPKRPGSSWTPVDLAPVLALPGPPEPSTAEEAWLRTTEAFDAVTDPLLALLDDADPALGCGYPGRIRR